MANSADRDRQSGVSGGKATESRWIKGTVGVLRRAEVAEAGVRLISETLNPDLARHDTESGDTSAASPAGRKKSMEDRPPGSNNARVAASKLLCNGQGRATVATSRMIC
jgi:hypothetical protein